MHVKGGPIMAVSKGDLVKGIIFLGLGLLFLLLELDLIRMRNLWPLILIVVGLCLLASYFLERRPSAP
jgi:hypothetical protein